jgi:hypothetical protein
MNKPALLVVLLLALSGAVTAQQRPDMAGVPVIASPSYALASGPRVAIDAAHNNFHTAEGHYGPFAALLRADGYRVTSSKLSFTRRALQSVDILVIANARLSGEASSQQLRDASAFSAAEITALEKWVSDGGSLLLIADHMPFPAASAELARAFGFVFYNGYVLNDTEAKSRNMITFSRQEGSLLEHPVTTGQAGGEPVDSVTSFLGQGFLAPPQARPIMQLQRGHYQYFPKQPGKITPQTTSISVERWQQGATLELGKGRLAVFGEAAMFSAQISGNGAKVGMNHPRGANNARLLRNTLLWLHPVPQG